MNHVHFRKGVILALAVSISATAWAAESVLTPAKKQRLQQMQTETAALYREVAVEVKEKLAAAFEADKALKGKYEIFFDRSRGKYEAYVWLRIGEKTTNPNTAKYYMIAFCEDDIDLDSGNIHTLFGRVQFWKDMKAHMVSGRRRYGTNTILKKSGRNVDVRLDFGNAKSYKALTDETFDTDELVAEFIQFLKTGK